MNKMTTDLLAWAKKHWYWLAAGGGILCATLFAFCASR